MMLLAKLCSNLNIAIPQIDSATQHYISGLPFAGNVRELENMLERALAMCDGQTITVDDLLHQDQIRVERRAVPRDEFHKIPSMNPELSPEINLPEYLEEIEKRAILQALEKTNQNKTAAAKLLGVSFRTLRYRLVKLGLSKESDAEVDVEIEDGN